MRELARGLMQIHGQGVTHPDIHGTNLLLMGNPLKWNSETPLVKYADFGVSSRQKMSEAEEQKKDVSDTFDLINLVATKAFNEQQVSEYIVLRKDMTAEGLLKMVEELADSLKFECTNANFSSIFAVVTLNKGTPVSFSFVSLPKILLSLIRFYL
jgi:serine/threonine protein kinase